VRNTVRLAAVLLTICVVTSGLLAFVDGLTSAQIEENAAAEASRLRGEALVGSGREVEFGEAREVGNLVCYEGTMNGKPVGTVFTAISEKGYGGPIKVIVGVDPTGEKITGVRIAEHTETPGLGANIVQVRTGEDEPWFLKQFGGLTVDRIALKPQGAIDAITAATISSTAVTDAVREGFEEFVKARTAQQGAE